MSKKYDTLVFIGRFQPVHNAHIETIRRATELCNTLVIIIGSAHQPATYKNPWSAADREQMLKSALHAARITPESQCQVRIEHNVDTMYNDQAWASRVQTIVSKWSSQSGAIGIIGHDKDESTFYLNMFPQWEREHVELIEPLNATDVRDLYFRENVNFNFISGVVPPAVLEYLQQYKTSRAFQQIVREREFIETYKRQYANLPYAPVFVTADAVVIQSGHVLLIRRRSEPGRGLLAIPGGFLNATSDKSVVDAALRELREETGIKVPLPVLRGNIKNRSVYDAIERSARGRTITHAVLIHLPDGPLPKVKGSDDADKAVWVPLGDLQSDVMFEDHFDIISDMVGKL